MNGGGEEERRRRGGLERRERDHPFRLFSRQEPNEQFILIVSSVIVVSAVRLP